MRKIQGGCVVAEDNKIENLEYELAIEYYCYGESGRYIKYMKILEELKAKEDDTIS